MLTRTKGDLVKAAVDGEINFLVHGCNCFSTWGAGIAKQIKAQFPKAYEIDRDDYREPYEKIGSYSSTIIKETGLRIINLYTQFDYGTNGRKFEYGAFRRAMDEIYADFYLENKIIGINRIGSGLAGADFGIVENILLDYTDRGNWILFEWDK